MNSKPRSSVTDTSKESGRKGRPKKPDALTPAARQAAYRQKKLEEGVEISLFLTHQQAAILRTAAKKEGKTQSNFVGELLEKLAST